ncbi:MAG: acylphosphatase [Pseudomonadota bacterium]
MADRERVHLFISGRVQGVAFRHYTRREALRLGLSGWVRNLPDGRVEAVLEGADPEVKAMVDWARHGPPGARVDHVEIQPLTIQGRLKGFEISL